MKTNSRPSYGAFPQLSQQADSSQDGIHIDKAACKLTAPDAPYCSDKIIGLDTGAQDIAWQQCRPLGGLGAQGCNVNIILTGAGGGGIRVGGDTCVQVPCCILGESMQAGGKDSGKNSEGGRGGKLIFVMAKRWRLRLNFNLIRLPCVQPTLIRMCTVMR